MAVSSPVWPSLCVGGGCCHGVRDRGRAAMCGAVGGVGIGAVDRCRVLCGCCLHVWGGWVLVLGVVMLGGREGKNGRFWTTRQEW